MRDQHVEQALQAQRLAIFAAARAGDVDRALQLAQHPPSELAAHQALLREQAHLWNWYTARQTPASEREREVADQQLSNNLEEIREGATLRALFGIYDSAAGYALSHNLAAMAARLQAVERRPD